jgi:amino acid transporter
VSTCYISVSAELTLMLPYYMLNINVPFPQAFAYVHMNWATPIVSVGIVAGFITCLYASMFPMPRVAYSLASDGLIFKFLAFVSPRFKTPFVAAITTGLFAGSLINN